MLEPRDRDPRRPKEIHVARRAWLGAWKSRLKKLGITCRMSEDVTAVDIVFGHLLKTIAATPTASGTWDAEEDSPGKDSWGDDALQLLKLPQQTGEIWQAVVRRVPTWLDMDGELKRPWTLLIVETVTEVIISTELFPEKPTPLKSSRLIRHAMQKPAVGPPRRPGVVEIESPELRDELTLSLDPVDVRTVVGDDLTLARRVAKDMIQSITGPRQQPSLVDSPGVALDQIGSFFTAAAEFYRRRPWRSAPGDTVIQVACDRFTSSPYHAVVMGQRGMEMGLAIYEDLELLRSILSGQFNQEEVARRSAGMSVTYGEIYDISPWDLEAMEQHQWPVASPEAYPTLMRVNPGFVQRTPLAWEIELMDLCLRAIPEFVAAGTDSARIDVSLPGGAVTAHLKWLEV
jgi:hypothetical protein